MKWAHKEKQPFGARLKEAQEYLLRNPDRVPIIVERSPMATVPEMDKRKFLVPRNLTLGQFYCTLRSKMKLKPEEALFFFVENVIPPTSSTVGSIYQEYKEDDLLLYIAYSNETAYGGDSIASSK